MVQIFRYYQCFHLENLPPTLHLLSNNSTQIPYHNGHTSFNADSFLEVCARDVKISFDFHNLRISLARCDDGPSQREQQHRWE